MNAVKITTNQLKSIINEEISKVNKENSLKQGVTLKFTVGELRTMLKEAHLGPAESYWVYLKGKEEPIKVTLSDDQVADIASDDPTEVPAALKLVLKKAYPDMEDFELA